MSSFSDGGFEIRREPERDSKAGGYGFGLWIHIGGGHYKHLEISKTDVMIIRREAGRALKELDDERR